MRARFAACGRYCIRDENCTTEPFGADGNPHEVLREVDAVDDETRVQFVFRHLPENVAVVLVERGVGTVAEVGAHGDAGRYCVVDLADGGSGVSHGDRDSGADGVFDERDCSWDLWGQGEQAYSILCRVL